ncbi:sugar transferase [Patescibacteria group bacterium]|nr:sugar transferase [Patescibacteria group bacterium]
MYISLYIALFLRNLEFPSTSVWIDHSLMFSYNFPIWLLFFYIAGLYNLHIAINNSKFIELSLKAILASTTFTIIFFYSYPLSNFAPKTILVLYLVLFTLLHFAHRLLINQRFATRTPKTNLAIIGYSPLVSEIIDETIRKPHLGYNIKFILNTQSIILDNPAESIQIINNVYEFKDKLLKKNISEVIITQNFRESEIIKEILFDCLRANINFINIAQFYEDLVGRLQLDFVDRTWFLENFNRINNNWYNTFKRIFDIIVSVLILCFTLPIWAIVAIAIKIENTGPIFFIDTRLGKNEKAFTLIKFRTMSVANNDQSPTTSGDPRVTKLGKLLRKTRIDEIPQILNVLKGDMSMVGPRPERPKLVTKLKDVIPFYSIRMLIKPGISGWDQVSGEYHSPSKEDTLKKLQYDFYYIKNRSIYLDITILLKTIKTVLSSQGV